MIYPSGFARLAARAPGSACLDSVTPQGASFFERQHMTQIQNIDNVVLKLSREHQIISDYVVRFFRNMKTPDPAFQEELRSFLGFMNKDLTRHFVMEELLFFPAALNGAPSYETSLLVLTLQKEHGSLETRLKAIQAMEKRVKEEKARDAALKKIGDFLTALKNHARREVTELFPLINENEQCMALLKEYVAQMNPKS